MKLTITRRLSEYVAYGLVSVTIITSAIFWSQNRSIKKHIDQLQVENESLLTENKRLKDTAEYHYQQGTDLAGKSEYEKAKSEFDIVVVKNSDGSLVASAKEQIITVNAELKKIEEKRIAEERRKEAERKAEERRRIEDERNTWRGKAKSIVQKIDDQAMSQPANKRIIDFISAEIGTPSGAYESYGACYLVWGTPFGQNKRMTEDELKSAPFCAMLVGCNMTFQTYYGRSSTAFYSYGKEIIPR